MQYENILIEMLSRIKTLEEEVNVLKQALSASSISPDKASLGSDNPDTNESAVSYQKITDEMIDACYLYGKKLHEGENVQELATIVSSETGMNRNSAIMYLCAVNCMLSETVYKRAISATATRVYFDKIFEEYHEAGLKKAVLATKLHIDHRRKCGHNVDSLENLCIATVNKYGLSRLSKRSK